MLNGMLACNNHLLDIGYKYGIVFVVIVVNNLVGLPSIDLSKRI